MVMREDVSLCDEACDLKFSNDRHQYLDFTSHCRSRQKFLGPGGIPESRPQQKLPHAFGRAVAPPRSAFMQRGPGPDTGSRRVRSLCERGISAVFLQGIPKSGTTFLEVAVTVLLRIHCADPASQCTVIGEPRSPGPYPMIVIDRKTGCEFEFEVPLPAHYVLEHTLGAERMISKHLYGGRLLQDPAQMQVLRNPCHGVLRVVRNPRDTIVSAYYWDISKDRTVSRDRFHKGAADTGATTKKTLLQFAELYFPRLLLLLEMQERGLHDALGGEYFSDQELLETNAGSDGADQHQSRQDQPPGRLHTVYYEELSLKPVDTLRAIGHYFGIDPTDATLKQAATIISLENMRANEKEGKLPGQSSQSRHGTPARPKVRSGEVNGYLREFNSPDKLACIEHWTNVSQISDSLRRRYTTPSPDQIKGLRPKFDVSAPGHCEYKTLSRDEVLASVQAADTVFFDNLQAEIATNAKEPFNLKACTGWLRCFDFTNQFIRRDGSQPPPPGAPSAPAPSPAPPKKKKKKQ